MKAVIQRVNRAAVRVDGATVGAIGPGLLILLGIGHDDGPTQVVDLAEKVAHLRIFEDAGGKTNLSIRDVGGSVLVVSQFTLYADTSRGRRPSFTAAARPEHAEPLVEDFCKALGSFAIPVEQGVFGAEMEIELVNAGPMTILLER